MRAIFRPRRTGSVRRAGWAPGLGGAVSRFWSWARRCAVLDEAGFAYRSPGPPWTGGRCAVLHLNESDGVYT